MRLFVLFLLVTVCQGTWFEENVYEESKRPDVDESSSTERRNLLLSVLVNLDKLYRSNSNSISERKTYGIPDGSQIPVEDDLHYDVDASVLKDVLKEMKTKPSKRARSDVSGVLPPFGELCRAMHLVGCSHSRHK